MMQEKYSFEEIEKHVQNYWDKNLIYKVSTKSNKKKYYCLSMLPYPSGKLHMGHVRNYTIGDVIARYQRMHGKNVLHPIGWDAFGLPAENAAIKRKILPSIWTFKNIQYMKKQLKNLGLSYDWNREITTCNPEYYKWEQWLFIELYKRKLAYKKNTFVNWCPKDKTVLANEQVIYNKCWRCNSIIQKKKISQWFLKITKYAEELLNSLDSLKKWPKKIIKMQKNWIGKSIGIEINFKLYNSKKCIKIYTTQPELIMGITYLIIPLDHPIICFLSKENFDVKKFINKYSNIKNAESEIALIEKKGISTNLFAVHPITKKKLPIWITNFIFQESKTECIGIPAHSKEHWEFAKKYQLPVKIVVFSQRKKTIEMQKLPILEENGILLNSHPFNKLSRLEARKKIIHFLENQKIGKYKIHYRLKDWSISRQRYWGAPIPILYLKNDNKIIPVPKKLLPIILPEKVNINDIIRSKKEKLFPMKYLINDQEAFLENDTFDTFIESSWYYARYTCPHYRKGILDSKSANYWLPIDQYIGGSEHATLHLLYFRFFHKILRDLGYINCNEPVKNLICQGMILAETFYYYEKDTMKWISKDKIIIFRNQKGEIISVTDNFNRKIYYAGMHKMSKSKNNGVNPENIIKKYGSDTLRLFIMSASPIDVSLEWKENGINGCYRFLNRLWNLVFLHVKKGSVMNYNTDTFTEQQKKIYGDLNHAIELVSTYFKKNHFNLAISVIMKLTKKISYIHQNDEKNRCLINKVLITIILFLFPFTPHISHVLWKYLGKKEEIDYYPWPKSDPLFKIKNIFFTLVIQINGKMREKIKIENDTKFEKIYQKVLFLPKIVKYLKKKSIIKYIYIPQKLINLVTE